MGPVPGMDGARGRLPNTGGAHAGQGDGDGVAVLNEGAKEKVPALTKTQKRNVGAAEAGLHLQRQQNK